MQFCIRPRTCGMARGRTWPNSSYLAARRYPVKTEKRLEHRSIAADYLVRQTFQLLIIKGLSRLLSTKLCSCGLKTAYQLKIDFNKIKVGSQKEKICNLSDFCRKQWNLPTLGPVVTKRDLVAPWATRQSKERTFFFGKTHFGSFFDPQVARSQRVPNPQKRPFLGVLDPSRIQKLGQIGPKLHFGNSFWRDESEKPGSSPIWRGRIQGGFS